MIRGTVIGDYGLLNEHQIAVDILTLEDINV